jgi:hypothetical protein
MSHNQREHKEMIVRVVRMVRCHCEGIYFKRGTLPTYIYIYGEEWAIQRVYVCVCWREYSV